VNKARMQECLDEVGAIPLELGNLASPLEKGEWDQMRQRISDLERFFEITRTKAVIERVLDVADEYDALLHKLEDES